MWEHSLTNVLVSGLGDDERAPARLLRDPVVVDLPVERVAVLLPAVSAKEESERSLRCVACHEIACGDAKFQANHFIRVILRQWGRVRSPVRLCESMHFSTHCWRAHSIVAGRDESHGLGKISRGE